METSGEGRYLGGRLYARHLSVEAIPGWLKGGLTLTWALDVSSNWYPITHNWMSSAAVGSLDRASGFTSPKVAAYGAMSCFATSSYFTGFTGRSDITSEQITVDGHPAWYLRSEVRVDFPMDRKVKGDIIDLVVVDTGDPDILSFYLSTATIDDVVVQKKVDYARTTLRVEP